MSNELKTVQQELPTIEPAPLMTPMRLMEAAIQSGVDADQLEKLMNLQERYESNQAQKAFSSALAGFQAVCPVITKNRDADRYAFASFDHIMKVITPHLAEAGLSVRFTTESTGDNIITAVCIVTHRDGHSEASQFAAPVDSQMRVNNTQKMGSANSYAKRYALLNALNISTTDDIDDDGAAAGEPPEPLATEKQHISIDDFIQADKVSTEQMDWYRKRESTLTQKQATAFLSRLRGET